MVQPSLRREGFSSIPDVTWDDVGGLDSLRREFDRCIVRCIRNPEDYEVNTELYLLTQRTVFYTS
jgi:ribosome biogenesis ATPase